jgi:tetratricopeptide (TPR) repeat protein
LLILAVRVRESEPIEAVFVALLVGVLIAGVTFGGLLFGLAATARHTYERMLSDRRAGDANHTVSYYTDGGDAGGARPVTDARDDGVGAAAIGRILARLTEVRDLMQVGPQASTESRERLRAHLQRNAAEEIINAINTRRLGQAGELLRDAEAAYGKTATLERLHAKIEEAAERNEPLDYGFTRRVAEEAISEGRWGLAEQCVQALFFDHPNSARCRRLWDDTRRARLYAHIQPRVVDHHWAEALAATEEFLERFPGSLEADALKGQVETLRTNAEILRRKQYEAKFKELIAAHNYREALRIAKHVVEQYPESPQAGALRDQIPLLEKRVAR